MVLTAAGAVRRTLVVPDEASWVMWGVNPQARGLQTSFGVATAEAVLRPAHVPPALAAVVDGWLSQRPALALVTLPSPLTPVFADQPPPGRPDNDAADVAEMDGEAMGAMDDMMAIVGDPSEDGLVMETVEVELGPLAGPLPGGLVMTATLDGEQVTESSVRSALIHPAGELDPMAPLSSRVALGLHAGRRHSGRLAMTAVETERALSHLAWLRSLIRLLGWHHGMRLCGQAIDRLLAVRSEALDALLIGRRTSTPTTPQLGAVQGAVDDLFHRVQHEPLVRSRLGGLAPVTSEDARSQGLRGPNARASGVADDLREGSAAYTAVDFRAAVTARAGDALARTAVRVEEVAQSLRLIGRLLHSDDPLPTLTAVEGARGPLRVATAARPTVQTLGGEAARRAAESAMTGLGWNDALVAVSSFDLSAWAPTR